MTEATQKAPGQPVREQETRSQWRDVWDQFTKHKGALIGAMLFFAIVFAVMLGPSLWPYEANEINIRLRNQNPSWAHPFGTDQLGRDTFARMIAGGQTSITVGLAAMMLSLMLGSLIGVLSGYYRRLDGILMRFTDLFLSLPLLPLPPSSTVFRFHDLLLPLLPLPPSSTIFHFHHHLLPLLPLLLSLFLLYRQISCKRFRPCLGTCSCF